MKIAVIGATGLVGSAMCEELARLLPNNFTLLLAASERSRGRKIRFNEQEFFVQSVDEVLNQRPDIALFAAGSALSLMYAEKFVAQGTYVVDNSSAWRMDARVPLVVPEINPEALNSKTKIIANPNCSTIQLVMALAPLREFGLKRMHVSTYQSVSGSGMRGIDQLQAEREGRTVEKPAYHHAIDLNCIPHCDDFLENGYTKEEMKLVNEPRKIFGMPELQISATAVRVPVWGGDSGAVSAGVEKEITPFQVRERLLATEGVTLCDIPEQNIYPLARDAYGSPQVFVGRIRQDIAVGTKGINLWIVADNIRKGAATNAVQIVQLLVRRFF